MTKIYEDFIHAIVELFDEFNIKRNPKFQVVLAIYGAVFGEKE